MNQIKPMRKNSPYYPKGRNLDDAALAEVRALLGDRPRRRDLLIEFLHLMQDAHGFLSAAHLRALAEEMRLSQAEVYETATFYHHFDLVKEGEAPPPPLTVRVCDGIACEMRGARILAEKLKSAAGQGVRVIHAPCVGACDRAPAAVVKQRQVLHAAPETVIAEIEAARFTHDVPDYMSLEAYQAAGGYKVLSECLSGARARGDLIREVEESGLRGLGGAGFPTARKWGFLKDAPKPRLVAVNADEGEPGTFKDRHILETEPHRFLEGVLLACWAVEAEAAYIYLRDEYPWCAEILHNEIARTEKAGLTGGARLHMRRGAGAYICGEESAMLESIEGKRGLPRNRPPFPAQAGLWGRPTLINNVETMYWLPEIAAKGAAWYQGEGRPHFYSVSGRVKNPGVKPAPAGVTARRLIEDFCGGMEEGETFYAYLPGGASGGVLPASLADEPLDFGALDKHGCFIGSSAVVVFSERDSIRDICKNLLRFFEDESCGQCTPCRAGCEKMLTLMEADAWDEPLMNGLSAVMADASICGLGQAAPNPVKSAFRFFKADL